MSHAMGKPRDVWPPTLAVLVGKVKPASVAGELPRELTTQDMAGRRRSRHEREELVERFQEPS